MELLLVFIQLTGRQWTHRKTLEFDEAVANRKVMAGTSRGGTLLALVTPLQKPLARSDTLTKIPIKEIVPS